MLDDMEIAMNATIKPIEEIADKLGLQPEKNTVGTRQKCPWGKFEKKKPKKAS